MDWHTYFMNICYCVAMKSKDTNTHIGAVVVGQQHEIRSTGFNGLPRGLKESDVRNERPEKYYWYEHGERNSIFLASKHGASLEGCTMYTNGIPCTDCARAIIQSGIITVVVDKKWDADNSEKWRESAKRSQEMFAEVGIKIIYWEGDVCVPKFRNGKEIKPNDM
jgi:dCMP deaminase